MTTRKMLSFITLPFALVCGLAAANSAPAGDVAYDPAGGAQCITDIVWSNSSEEYTLRINGGELTLFQVAGDGDTDLDLFIYDEAGNLLGSDMGPSDFANVLIWVPRSTVVTIEVQNLGGVYNEFALCAE